MGERGYNLQREIVDAMDQRDERVGVADETVERRQNRRRLRSAGMPGMIWRWMPLL